ncbi:ATP-binding cassette domain-containing protein [Lacticaseibacillus jixiensis]|uniref:ATP-binding cassette domain-containing protein n=1 Tax=Lacticaseibacillus jixiensis TaxID=3231926 RepID=UPI0036F31C88
MSELVITDIHKDFAGKPVLTGVTTTFQEATIYGLLGRNGVGKSTLMKIINNRLRVRRGTITLDGESVFENERAQNRIFLMSDAKLWPSGIKIKQLFKLVGELYGSFDTKLAAELARKFRLNVDERLGKQSTGYQTIANLVVALCVPCDFVFLDEPVLGLDANHRELFYQEFLATYAMRPRTFVIATHLIEEVSGLLSHVMVIDRGQVRLDEDTETLQQLGRVVSGPAALVEDYLTDVPVISSTRLGGMLTAYTLHAPLQRPLPADVSLDGIQLQRLFIELTKDGDEDEV